MRSTIDKAGRVVIPAQLRTQLGVEPGPVDVEVDGAGIRIEIPVEEHVEQVADRLIITAPGPSTSADQIRELRLADQR